MKKRASIIGLTLLAGVAAFTPVAATVADSVLILGIEADENAVPRDSEVYRQIKSHLSEQMAARGFEPVAADGANIRFFSMLIGTALSNAVLLRAAEAARAGKVDAVVAFSLYIRTLGPTSARRLESRLSGRYLGSDGVGGAFDVTYPETIAVSANCNRVCLLAAAGVQAKDLATALADDIVARLSATTAVPEIVEPAKTPTIAVPKNTPETTLENMQETMAPVQLPATPPSQATAPAQTEIATLPLGPDEQTIVLHGFTSDELDLVFKYVPDFEGHIAMGELTANGMETRRVLKTESDRRRIVENFELLLRHLDITASVEQTADSLRMIRK